MKANKLFMVILILTTFAFVYCKKSKETPESLVGKWLLDSVQIKTVVNNQIEYQTILRSRTDYYDYRADNKLYRYMNNVYDTLAYQLVLQNGKSLIKYNFSADTIIAHTKGLLILTNALGGGSKFFFNRY